MCLLGKDNTEDEEQTGQIVKKQAEFLVALIGKKDRQKSGIHGV